MSGAFPMRDIGNGQQRATLAADPSFPLVARFRLADGRVTDPVLVHHEDALRRASPGVIGKRLIEAFGRVERGEEDLIDLALQAHSIFAPDADVARSRRSSGSGERRDQGSAPTREFATPEEFRKSLELKPADGRDGRYVIEDPGLLYMLKILVGGIMDVVDPEAEQRREREEDEQANQGEKEDGNEEDPDPSTPAPSGKLDPAHIGRPAESNRVYRNVHGHVWCSLRRPCARRAAEDLPPDLPDDCGHGLGEDAKLPCNN